MCILSKQEMNSNAGRVIGIIFVFMKKEIRKLPLDSAGFLCNWPQEQHRILRPPNLRRHHCVAPNHLQTVQNSSGLRIKLI